MSPDALAMGETGRIPRTITRPWDVPDGWTWGLLHEVTEAPATSDPRKQGQVFTYIDVNALAAGKIQSAQRLQAEKAPSRARQLVKQGDTLFSGVRVYLKNIALIDQAHDGAIASTAFCILRPTAAVDPRYLFFFLNRQAFINSLLPLQRGNSPPAVLDSDVRAQPIPVAPLPEQRRIVARIDELLADIEEGEAALQRARRDLDTWRRALLKAAVTGELTREWREAYRPVESGVDLLARIRAERSASDANCSRKRRANPVLPSDNATLAKLPEGWVWASVQELFAWSSGDFLPARSMRPGNIPVFGGNGIPGITINH